MKRQTTYYIIGAVLVGVGIFLYSTKNKNKSTLNLDPPMVVTEEDDVTPEENETTILTVFEKLKSIIDSIKSKDASTPPINN
jgi:hypothetical protein